MASDPLDIAKLRELEKAATPAPWSKPHFEGKYYGTEIDLSDGSAITIASGDSDGGGPSEEQLRRWRFKTREEASANDLPCDWHYQTVRDAANAALISALRNAAPTLLDAIEAQEKEIARLRAMVGEAKCIKHDELFVGVCWKCHNEEKAK